MSHSKHLRFGHSPLGDQRCLGIGDQLRSDNQCKELLPPPPPPRWGLVSKASRIAVDSRSKGALKFCPAAVSQERKGQEGAGGHSSRPKGNEGVSPFLYRGTSLLLGAVFSLLAASNGFANGGSGDLPRRPQVNTQQCPECPVQHPQPNSCSGSENK